jgi:hypothetical protein
LGVGFGVEFILSSLAKRECENSKGLCPEASVEVAYNGKVRKDEHQRVFLMGWGYIG